MKQKFKSVWKGISEQIWKKALPLTVAAGLLMTGLTGVCAQDSGTEGHAVAEPAYLMDEQTEYTRENPGEHSIILPDESYGFHYDLGVSSVLYSDVIFSPQENDRSIKFGFQASPFTHWMTIEVIDKTTGEAVFSQQEHIGNEGYQETAVDFMDLKVHHGYYFKLSGEHGGRGIINVSSQKDSRDFEGALELPNRKSVSYEDIGDYSGNLEADSRVEDMLTGLGQFDIMNGYPDNTFRPEQTITRAELVKSVLAAQNLYSPSKADLTNDQPSFTDVDASHWAYAYIETAKELGLVEGNGDGTFSPENPVTYEEAAKMLVTMIGYDRYAKDTGGFPSGYVRAVERYGLSEDARGIHLGEPITRRNAGILLYHALNAPLMVEVEEGTAVILDGSAETERVTLFDRSFSEQ